MSRHFHLLSVATTKHFSSSHGERVWNLLPKPLEEIIDQEALLGS